MMARTSLQFPALCLFLFDVHLQLFWPLWQSFSDSYLWLIVLYLVVIAMWKNYTEILYEEVITVG